MPSIRVSDSHLLGKESYRFDLLLPSIETTARQIIQQRICQEVEKYQQIQSEKLHHFSALVQPIQAEVVLNNYQKKTVAKQNIDIEAQCLTAYDAFEHNGFFLLVDERQVTDLDEPLLVTDVSTIQFVKLVPLVGG